MMEEEARRPKRTPQLAEFSLNLSPHASDESAADPEVTERGDSGNKAKTTMPRIAGGYKLPSSSLLQRPDEQQQVDADELKLLAQVLTEKYAEFEVHGQDHADQSRTGRHDV